MISGRHLRSPYPIAFLISTTSKLLIGITNKGTMVHLQIPKLSRSLHNNKYCYSNLENSKQVNLKLKGISEVAQKTYFSTDVKKCWSCQSSIHLEDMFFCGSCSVIQPPNVNVTYFGYFDRHV